MLVTAFSLRGEACVSNRQSVADVSGLFKSMMCNDGAQKLEVTRDLVISPPEWPIPASLTGYVTLSTAPGGRKSAIIYLQGVDDWIILSRQASLTMSNISIYSSHLSPFLKNTLYHSVNAMLILDNVVLTNVRCTTWDDTPVLGDLPANHTYLNCKDQQVEPSLSQTFCLGNECWQDVLVHHSTCLTGPFGSTIWFRNNTVVLCGTPNSDTPASDGHGHQHKSLVAVTSGCTAGAIVLLLAAGFAFYKWRHASRLEDPTSTPPGLLRSSMPAMLIDVELKKPQQLPYQASGAELAEDAPATGFELSTGFTISFTEQGRTSAAGPSQEQLLPLPKEEVLLCRYLGQGSYGCVYKARWGRLVVAVKILEHSAEMLTVIDREVKVMSTLAHRNVMGAMGVLHQASSRITRRSIDLNNPACRLSPNSNAQDLSAESGPVESWIVMELCFGGSLDDFIKSREFFYGQVLDLKLVLTRLLEIARGMAYLHHRNIWHGDLKPGNILLTSQDPHKAVAKVADFGLSRCMEAHQTHIQTKTKGTLSHTPPEMFVDGVMTPSADIYAFGIIMYECATGLNPFSSLTMGQLVQRVVAENLRPMMPTYMPPAYTDLAQRCWAADRTQRPTFEEVVLELEVMLRDAESLQDTLTSTVHSWLSSFGF